MIKAILVGLEKRGNDATGLAMQKKDGEVLVYKHDTAAWNFVASQGFTDFLAANLNDEIIQVILHTRAATQGSPRKNANNHPLFTDKSAVVHNGMINNDDQLFRELKIERGAETDTDIFRAITDKWGFTSEAIKNLNKVRGSAAIAVLHPEYPGKLLIGRSGNPICLGSRDNDFLYFASEKDILHAAMRPWVQRFGLAWQEQAGEMAFSLFPDDTLWLMGEKGYEEHTEFRTSYGTYREPNRRIYGTGFQDRQNRWNNSDSDGPVDTSASHTASDTPANIVAGKESTEKVATKVIVSCPKCDKKLALSPVMQDRLSELQCPTKRGGCGTALDGARAVLVH